MSTPMVEVQDLALRAGERTLVEGLSIQVGSGERWVSVSQFRAPSAADTIRLSELRRPAIKTACGSLAFE